MTNPAYGVFDPALSHRRLIKLSASPLANACMCNFRIDIKQ